MKWRLGGDVTKNDNRQAVIGVSRTVTAAARNNDNLIPCSPHCCYSASLLPSERQFNVVGPMEIAPTVALKVKIGSDYGSAIALELLDMVGEFRR